MSSFQQSHRGIGALAPPLPAGTNTTMFMPVDGTPIPPPLPGQSNSLNLSNHLPAVGALGARYGSAEHGYEPRGRSRRPRARSRDRSELRSISSMHHRPQIAHRARTIGPQTTADITEVINNVLDRVETCENNMRRQGQALAVLEARYLAYAEDIANYKEWINKCFESCDKNVGEQLGTLARRAANHDNITTSLDHNFAIADARLQSLIDGLEELKNSVAQAAAVPRGPDYFRLSTPAHAEPESRLQPPHTRFQDNSGSESFLRAQHPGASSNLSVHSTSCAPPMASLLPGSEIPTVHVDSQGVRGMPN